LQYILFEALSNALQHAGATRLVLMARQTEGRLTLSLIDNGVGMPPGSEQGQGLQGMVGRAAVIGGQLEFVRPTQGGLEVRLTLPWQASDWSGLSSAA
jgi:signal transduction histidine kinase